MPSEHLTIADPAWLAPLLGAELPSEGGRIDLRGQSFVRRNGILRSAKLMTESQTQTADAFGFKWHKRDTFERPESLARMKDWLIARYGNVTREAWFAEHGPSPLILDAGCGAGMSAIELFEPCLKNARYLGIDVSAAVDVAAARFAQRGWSAAFLQADLNTIPVAPESIDVIFSEGVLHHTDSTEAALKSVVPLLKMGGRILFYVYKKKGPLREFTDDYIRDRLQAMTPDDAWKAVEPLTRLGETLGKLDIEIDIPEPIEILDIPAGRINLQRFFYWHVAKAFYRPDYTFDEMNHINYDWYAPRNAYRQTPDEVRRWCQESGLVIERERVEEAGITVVARRATRGA
jgi:SAM-dependent methyltransferase